MRSRVKIQGIVNTKMEELIPGWETLSPTDPLKVFSEGIICALAEVDQHSKKNINSMLDMIPSILSFYPKKPSLAKGLFNFKVKDSSQTQLTIPKGLKLKYKSDNGQSHNILFDEQKVEPYKLINASKEKDKLTLEYQVFGKIEAVSFFFIRNRKEHEGSQIQKAKLKVIINDEESFFDTNGLKIQDSTKGITKTGQVKLTPIDYEFPDTQYKLIIEISALERSNPGDFYTNLVVGNICDIRPETNLGFLQGQIWEEVKLPQNIISPPKKINIELPTGENFDLKIAESDILKVKEFDMATFVNSYLYNGIHHTLNIPNAEVLLQNKLGGAEIKAKNLIYTVKETSFPKQDTRISLEGLEGVVSEVVPLCVISPVIERENKDQFLSRFYRTLNKFYSYATNQLANFSEDELKTNILNFDQSVRAVEVKNNYIDEIYQIFILSFNPFLHQEKEIETKIIEKVQEHAHKIAPLDKKLVISPFKNKSYTVDVSLCLKQITNSTQVIDQNQINSILETTCADFLLPWPFGQMRIGKKYERADLEKLLESCLPFNSEEIEEFRITILDGETLVHLEALSRDAGECIIPRVNLHLELNEEEAKDEEMILSSSSIDILDDDEVFDVFD